MGLGQSEFISHTIQKCVDNSISFKLLPQKTHQRLLGFFDNYNLVTCTNNEEWLSTLVHESCHLDQFLAGYKPFFDPVFDKVSIWEPEHRVKDPILFKKAFRISAQIEINCDRRAVKKIKKYNLDIDLDYYRQTSNFHHATYYYFHKTGKSLQMDSEILDLFPTKSISSLKTAWRERKDLDNFLKSCNTPL